MATRTMRKIVTIDEDKCNGCGLCIPNCAEGAIRIIDGKARLVADNLCDGLGACLGHCPMDAITVRERPAEEFDEHAVQVHLAAEGPQAAPQTAHKPALHHGEAPSGGCPGTRMRMLKPSAAPSQAQAQPSQPVAAARQSQLGHWPVQLALVPTAGAIWQDADVLICADCVPFAYPEFHENLLAGKSLAIACPKLDDVDAYVEKLTTIFANNSIKSITVAHMEVPCCSGIVFAVASALERSGRNDIPVRDITVGIDGTVKRQGAME